MATTAVDPFTIEIIKNSLVAIGDEMFYALQRTSKSTIIYETLDYGVAITDDQGRLVAQGNGVPLFIGTLDAATNAVPSVGSAMMGVPSIACTRSAWRACRTMACT